VAPDYANLKSLIMMIASLASLLV